MIRFRLYLMLKNFSFRKAPLPQSRKFGEDIRASLSVAQCMKGPDKLNMDLGLEKDRAILVQPDVLGYAQNWRRTDSQPYSSSQNNPNNMGNTISEIFGGGTAIIYMQETEQPGRCFAVRHVCFTGIKSPVFERLFFYVCMIFLNSLFFQTL